ncbi:MAG: DHH family phosphoesterase [Proteobacteria bacterium]|nr:DHH family phosphoesterase [Candidatus Enterousia scatequi]
MKENVKSLIEKIATANSIAVIAHKNPDADALCSVLAMRQLIKLNFNKDCVCVYDGNIPENLEMVPLRPLLKYYEHTDLSVAYDLVILLDYGTVKNIGGPQVIIDNAKFVAEIDHHKNDNKLGALCIDNENAVATGEVLFDILTEANWKKDNFISDLIALAILTDSGNFKFARNGNALRIMAQLVDGGVNIGKLLASLNNKPPKAVQTEARVASEAEFFYHKRLVLATMSTRDYRHIDGRGEIVLGLLNQIKGVEYIVLLKQQKQDQIGVSLRSKTQPVNQIAEALGGGGHMFASGAVVRDSLENVRAKVLELFKGI